MKRYISAVLIPCLFMQLFGCYSMREMTEEELKNFNGTDDIILKTNQNEILIYRKSSENNPMDWQAGDSLIIVKTKEQVKWENYDKSVDKITEIKLNKIERIEMDEFDLLETSLLIAGIVGIIIFLAVVKPMTGPVSSI